MGRVVAVLLRGPLEPLSFGITFGRQAEKHIDLHHSFDHLVPVAMAIANALPSPPAALG